MRAPITTDDRGEHGGRRGLLTLVRGVALLLTARREYLAVRVRGRSMHPTYRDGDLLLARRFSAFTRGSVVVLHDPAGTAKPLLVKRVAAVAGERVPFPARERDVPDGFVVVLGDNPDESRDSRAFGLVPARQVIATIVRKLQ
jgi:signal peptidase I